MDVCGSGRHTIPSGVNLFSTSDDEKCEEPLEVRPHNIRHTERRSHVRREKVDEQLQFVLTCETHPNETQHIKQT